MTRELQCDCGFKASGPDTNVEELTNIAVQHVKDAHPEMMREQGESAIRAAAPSFIKTVDAPHD